jgi:ribulose-phosphate 3-epimerase
VPPGRRPFFLAPSLLSADFADLAQAMRSAEEGGANAFHLDVMDGHFVPNITFGPALVRAVRARTRLPLDLHLMIRDPGAYLARFAEAGGDTLAFHFEAEGDMKALAAQVRKLGKRPGLAVRPDTPFERFESILPDFDEVVVMTVMPGFSGQKFMTEVLPKMRRVREAIDRAGRAVDLSVDGGVTVETIGAAEQAGANFFVCGNSVYNAAASPQTNLRALWAKLPPEVPVEVR